MKRAYSLIAYIIIIFTIFWSFKDSIPSYNDSDMVKSDTIFSINNALYHLKNISKKPHYTGTNEHRHVQNYLYTELQKLGLVPEIQQETVINTKWKAATTVENIITRIKGTNNKGEALLLLSHYDSNAHSSPGASDAGSGVVTILETLRAFLAKNKKPYNDIVIMFSDAEELGLLGAQAFVQKHPYAKDIGLVLNFEARGSGGSSYMLMETNGKNKNLLEAFLNSKTNFPAANSLMYSVYKILPNDTDLTVFREEGNINGFNFAFIDDHFDYHTQQDTYERLDRNSLMHQADYLTNTLHYFTNSDLSTLDSDEDLVFVNFPVVKMISYPFNWIIPMLLLAGFILLIFISIGLRKNTLTLKGIFMGCIPFLISLVLSGLGSYFLWQLVLLVHPEYNDILHGFPYNGYSYIIAFSFLNMWFLFKVYSYFSKIKSLDLFIAPILLSVLLNWLFAYYLPGAAFMILPVFSALFILGWDIFSANRKGMDIIFFAIVSIPTVYIITPLIQLFPVGLGVKMLFVSSLFITLLFGYLLPILVTNKKQIIWQKLFLLIGVVSMIIATYNSGFSSNNKKPNSLVFIQNSDENTSYWATYNTTFDTYTKQIFNAEYSQGNIPSTSGRNKYNTRYTYYKKAENKNIPVSSVIIHKDSLYDGKRVVSFSLTPNRKIDKYELYTSLPYKFYNLSVNGASYDKGSSFQVNKGTLLSYQMANSDKDLTIEFTIDKDMELLISINEISYDLLTHPKFYLKPRDEKMMPMPFVINDAIITTKTVTF